MNPTITAAIICACLCAAVMLGMRVRRLLPEQHLTDETKGSVARATALIATMAALLLGLLISSAQGSYDTVRSEVTQMAAKLTFLDRILKLYGPDAAPLREQLRATSERSIERLWSGNEDPHSALQAGDALYVAIQGLPAPDETRQALKQEASAVAIGLGELRTLVHAQSTSSTPTALIIVVTVWLGIIFFNFSLIAQPNGTATSAMFVSAVAVAGAVFLILEMDRPFTGIMRISSAPLADALGQASR